MVWAVVDTGMDSHPNRGRARCKVPWLLEYSEDQPEEAQQDQHANEDDPSLLQFTVDWGL